MPAHAPEAGLHLLYGRTAHGGEIESILFFLDDVFHPATATVVLYDLVWLQVLHCCDNECVHVDDLPIGFLSFKCNPARIVP